METRATTASPQNEIKQEDLVEKLYACYQRIFRHLYLARKFHQENSVAYKYQAQFLKPLRAEEEKLNQLEQTLKIAKPHPSVSNNYVKAMEQDIEACKARIKTLKDD